MKSQPAMTLVELLVVIAILFVLISVLMPMRFGCGGPESAREISAVKTQMSSLLTGFELFRSDFGYYPSSVPQDKDGRNLEADVVNRGVVNGFHRMAFAMIGRDRIGCPSNKTLTETHPGLPAPDSDPGPDSVTGLYYVTNPNMNRSYRLRSGDSSWGKEGNRTSRKGPYISQSGLRIVEDKVVDSNGHIPVICDRYEQKRTSEPEIISTSVYRKHSIILYFAKRGTGKNGLPGKPGMKGTFHATDNWRMLADEETGRVDEQAFQAFLKSRKEEGKGNPRLQESSDILLISPGRDGKFLTEDDIIGWN